jgi:hypothetical protein
MCPTGCRGNNLADSIPAISPPGITDEDSPNYQARRGRLTDLTLQPHAATVEVRFELNGVAHLIRRRSQDGTILIKIANDEMRACTEDEVRSLLAIQRRSRYASARSSTSIVCRKHSWFHVVFDRSSLRPHA